jgi:hypothetical protein
MKPTILMGLAFALLAVVLYYSRIEKFQPEFLDKSQVRRTVAAEDSHYEQYTNHMTPSPASMGPIAGMETPFQVNQYKAFVQ